MAPGSGSGRDGFVYAGEDLRWLAVLSAVVAGVHVCPDGCFTLPACVCGVCKGFGEGVFSFVRLCGGVSVA